MQVTQEETRFAGKYTEVIEVDAELDASAEMGAPIEVTEISDMQAVLDADPGTDESAPSPVFVIDTESKANWALGKMATVRAEQARIQAQTAARMAELDADYRKLERKFSNPLEQFARLEAERRGRRTITLMQGTMSLKKVAGSWIVQDTEESRAKAKIIAPDALREVTEVKFDKVKYKAAALAIMKDTGEIVEGLEKTADKENFKIEFGKGES